MSELAVAGSINLPSTWAIASLGDIATLSPKSDTSNLEAKDLVHFVPMAEVAENFGGINISKLRVFDEVRKGYTSFAENDVLFAKITPCMENGKGALVPPLPNKYAFGSTEFHVIRPSIVVLPKWIAHYLAQPDFRTVARRNMTGTAGQMRVPSSWLANVGIPLASIAEQTRIVEKLEELLSDLDAGVAELKAAQRKLAQYRQSLLKAAVEGALTADWRNARARSDKTQETGANLLQRILTERRNRWETKQLAKFTELGKTLPKDWKSKYEEPLALNTSELPDIPDGWAWATLGQLTESLTSGSRDWASYYDRGTCTFVMAQNVRPWRPDFSYRQLVDPPEGNRDRARSAIEMDDLLLTIVGANTGQACRVPEELQSHFVCQSVALIRLTDPSLSEFINAVLNSPEHGQKQFREMNYGAGRPHLSFDQVESVLVPIPPLSEQLEILEQFGKARLSVAETEKELLQGIAYSAAQRKNILKAAFAGQLVPQDPNDEPASALLERIRAARATDKGGVSGITRKVTRKTTKEAR